MSEARQSLVSVVTPVYNGAEHLRECIDSVLAQTWTNWDYTIVDNCSSDATFAIASEYAARDARIRVVRNDSLIPVIANHNVAVRHASPRARYCKVLAGDDTLAPACLAEMVRVAEANPRIAIVASYSRIGARLDDGGAFIAGESLSGREVCRHNLLGGPYVFGAPTTVLYRADIVRSRAAFYDESNIHADTEVCFEFLVDNDFGFVHEVLSFVRVREGSGTSRSLSWNTYLAGWLLVLQRHGARFLDEAELAQCTGVFLEEYYRFLGGELFKRRGSEFWSYHRARLAELGHPLEQTRLARHAAGFVLDRGLRHPGRTLRNIARRLGGSGRAS